MRLEQPNAGGLGSFLSFSVARLGLFEEISKRFKVSGFKASGESRCSIARILAKAWFTGSISSLLDEGVSDMANKLST